MSELKIFTEYSGVTFKKLLGDTKLYRFTNLGEVHHKFHYKTGLNKDNMEFNPSGSCKSGGIYFCDETELIKYLESYEENNFVWIREVEIPDDARVYVDHLKYKTNQIILKKRMHLDDFRIKNITMMDLIVNARLLKFIENQTEELCKIMMRTNPFALEFVRNQTEEMCEIAIRIYPFVLKFVKNQTDKLCKIAIIINPLALKCVKNQTEELCRMAIMENPLANKFVKIKYTFTL